MLCFLFFFFPDHAFVFEMLLSSSRSNVIKSCYDYQFPTVQQKLYSCELKWTIVKFHIYTLLKTL